MYDLKFGFTFDIDIDSGTSSSKFRFQQFSKFVYTDTCKSEGPEYRKNMPIIKVTITESTAFIKIILRSKIPR